MADPTTSSDDLDTGDLDTSGGDLLSAALSAAGLDEFFIAPASDDAQRPSTSTVSKENTTLSNAAVERCQETRAADTPLPGVTASASASPDLPTNASSQSVNANGTLGKPLTAQAVIPKPIPAIQNAKMIKIIRADGTPVFVPLPKAGLMRAPGQGPVRILIPAKLVAASPEKTSVATTLLPRPAESQPGTTARSEVVAPSIPSQHHFPSAPNLQAIRSQHPSASGLTSAPGPSQRPFVLGRSRLLPAMVPSSSMRSTRPPLLLRQQPTPLLPPSLNTIPKRSRLVNFNPNVGVIERASTNVRLPAPGKVPIVQRFAVDHEKNLVSAAAEIVSALEASKDPPTTQQVLVPTTQQAVVPTTQQAVVPTAVVPKMSVAIAADGPSKKESKSVLQETLVVEEEEDEEFGFAETYAEYIPAKLRSGLSHPDQVVETSSMSSVLPPDVHYHISIPEEVIDTGKLSALQLEAVIYACQKTETFLPSGERAGYLIGDGPGVGKGRTIAGFIYENYLLGRKRALWFSVSSDLKYDSERDLRDIGAGRIKVFALNKFKYAKISGKENGSVKKGVIFATYSSLIGESNSAKSKYRSRLKQLLQWCGKDFDGVIVFDECHRAKNLVPTGSTKPSKTGQTVLELQKALPKARVLYASATGATETRNMAYMTRLGLWGEGKPFKDFNEFITAVEKRGVGAMEIVAMDMKLRGLYIARQLSFAGVSFRIEEVPLTEEFIRMYDESVKLWLEAKKQFRLAGELISIERAQKKAMWSQFWAAHQRFFKYLCVAAKVKECVRMTREHIKNGKCVVIGLQSTGEARTLDQLEEMGGELTDFVSTAKGVFQALIERHFPTADDSGVGRSSRKPVPADDLFWGDDDDFFTAMKPARGAWKRKLVAEHRERKKKAKLGKDFDEVEWPSSSSSSDNDGEDDKSESDISEKIASERSESEDNSSILYSSDEDNEGSQSDTDTGDDTEDKFNPFADDAEEADPWENKIIVKSTKRKRKRRRSNQEHDEELERQLELALQEASGDEAEKEEPPKLVKKKERVIPAVSANDFLTSSSSYIDFTFKPGRFASELGLDRANVIKAELLAAVERLGEILPPNTLDQLIDELGGPEYVAEMTGRKGRVVSKDDGEILYELRNDDYDVPLELLNVAEREKFMNGEKHIAIISEAASSGISLQSDRRAKNQRRRVHITLELPWSADKAVQQFGRTHRSNQVSAPEYVFLISELAGEQRFASIVAKRLESLGALTHGDRRATESRDLSQFNLDTKYGRTALDVTLKSIINTARSIVQPPADYKGDFVHDMRIFLEGVGVLNREDPKGNVFTIEKDTNLAKFLNRLLGLPVLAQNSLFQYFSDTVREIVGQAKRDFKYDLGIMDLGHGGEMVRKVQTQVFVGKFETGSLKTELHTVMVERGLAWEDAMDVYRSHSRANDGFYVLSNNSVSPTVILICDAGKKRSDTAERLYHVYRPNIGLSVKMETFTELKKRFKKVTPDKAEPVWKEHFDTSSRMCQHEYWFGRCRNNGGPLGLVCDVGRRKRAYHIVSGSVLTVWNTVENVMSILPGRRQRCMQVVRVRTDTGQKIVGILIPPSCKKTLIEKLAEESSRTYTESFD